MVSGKALHTLALRRGLLPHHIDFRCLHSSLPLQHPLRRYRGVHGAVVAVLGAGARPPPQRTLRPLRPARQRELHPIGREGSRDPLSNSLRSMPMWE